MASTSSMQHQSPVGNGDARVDDVCYHMTVLDMVDDKYVIT